MVIKDVLYGEFEIPKILEDLINSTPVQRLKHIHQGGANYLINPKWNVTRYEHSIGTMLLVKILGGSIEEQIAALLHDISHTAFSHVVDLTLDYSNEDYHENIYNEVVLNSEIPTILSAHGYYFKDILNHEEKWTILESPSPKLCADRIDYTLRDMFSCEKTTIKEVSSFIKTLRVIDGSITIVSPPSAKWFVELYYEEVIGFFMNPFNIYANVTLSKALKVALDNKIISFSDFLLTDDELLCILRNSNSTEVLDLINSIKPGIKLIESSKDFDIHQINKVRTIDPPLLINNKIIPSSEYSKEILELNKNALSKSLQGIYLKII